MRREVFRPRALLVPPSRRRTLCHAPIFELAARVPDGEAAIYYDCLCR